MATLAWAWMSPTPTTWPLPSSGQAPAVKISEPGGAMAA